MKKIKKLFYIFFPLILGLIVSFLTRNGMNFSSLNMPPLAPPKILFPIAWSIIYLLMGLSFYLYKKNSNVDSDEIDKFYYGQLAINVLWSIIFFNLKIYWLAVIWIILLDVVVILLLKKFKITYPVSYYLNLLYLVWILFATYLTIGIFVLN